MACSASREAEAGRVSASRAGGHAPRTRERVARKSASRACFCVTVTYLIFSRVRFSVSGDGTLTELSGRGIMSAKAGSGISVMRSDLDASTSTEVDAHEAQWRAGVNRQARPDAPSQRRAASLAAAAKRRRIRT